MGWIPSPRFILSAPLPDRLAARRKSPYSRFVFTAAKERAASARGLNAAQPLHISFTCLILDFVLSWCK